MRTSWRCCRPAKCGCEPGNAEAAPVPQACVAPLRAHLPGGELVLEWDGGDASVRMTGPAVEVFEGTLDLGVQPAAGGEDSA